jgi:hypothetical protein
MSNIVSFLNSLIVIFLLLPMAKIWSHVPYLTELWRPVTEKSNFEGAHQIRVFHTVVIR